MFIAVAGLGMIAFALATALRQNTLAFSLGATTSAVVVVLPPGSTACQAPIDVRAHNAFDRIAFQVGTYNKPGPPLTVTVRNSMGRQVARGNLRGGYPDVGRAPWHTIRLGRLVHGRRLSVCLLNTGSSKVAIYGSGDHSAQPSSARLDGKPVGRDMNIQFHRPGRSYASMLGTMLNRASLWRSPRLSGGAYGLLVVALVLIGVAALFVAARSVEDRAPARDD